MLSQLADNLWIAEMPQRLFNVQIGARMTVVRLRGGALWIHSPIQLTNRLKQELDTLGPVQYLVAPNHFHYQHLSEYSLPYPSARFYMTQDLARREWNLPEIVVLGEDSPPEWNNEIEQTMFRGSVYVDEIAFLHRESRTLILTDLCFHLEKNKLLWTRLYARLVDVYGKFAAPRTLRFSISDKVAARASIDRILEWDFDHILIAHGKIVQCDGHHTFKTAFKWLVSPETSQ
jgi:hypothetical protein